jgi:hypothetical protein
VAAHAAHATAAAQWTGQTTIDVGAVRLRRPDFADTMALSLAGLWLRASDRLSLTASGAASVGSSDRATGLGLLSASAYAAPARFRWEIGGTGTALGTPSVRPAIGWTVFGREHLADSAAGGWLGLSSGKLRAANLDRTVTVGELGGWIGDAKFRLGASLSHSWADANVTLPPTTTTSETVVRQQLEYTDAVIQLRHMAGSFDLDVSGSLRMLTRGTLDDTPGAAVGAVWWFTPHMGLAAAAGRQLSDPVRGMAEAGYLTASIRLSAERRGPPRAVRPDSSGLLIGPRREDDGGVRLTLRAPNATHVEVMGDFTDWQPVPLARAGDQWEATVRITPGSHHLLLRLDDGEWSPPTNLPRVRDGFGGIVGLLVVP